MAKKIRPGDRVTTFGCLTRSAVSGDAVEFVCC